LVSNSTLNFDFLSIFNIKPPIIVAFLAISCYYLSLFVLVNKLTEFFAGKFIWNLTGYFFLLIGICLVIKNCFNYNQQFENYWLLVFSLPVFLFSRINTAKNALIIGFQILILSIITSVFLNFYINQNQKLDLKLLSFSLSERKDAILESEFNSVSDKLFNDEKLKVLLDFLPNSEKEIVQLLKQKYFGGYFNRYTIEFSMFDKNCKPLFSVKDPILLNEGFFEDQIKLFETDSISNNLFFVGSYKKSSRYIAKLPMSETNLYLRLEPKQFEELGSFPDLLLDQSQQKPDKLKKFSHAVYRSGQLSSRYGEFNYPYFMADSLAISKSDVSYTHYFFHPDDQTEIIISQNSKNLGYYFTYNSYLFLFFSVICYCIYFIYSLFFIKNFTSASFTRRIQFIIIILILLAISAVGYTSTKLVSNQFEADNIQQLKEKTQTIISEFTTQFNSIEIFDPSQQELVNLKIKEYAHLFKTDISLFSKTGSLFTTSEPRLYELGLAATRINPKAFKDLMDNKTSSTTINEKAGDLNYLSFYTPLFDNKKEIIGFINLPYYAKQTDLTNELSNIISAFINVYVILFVISVLSGLILAGYITRPLQLIKKQIANITLGKQNEKIKWESNDEIGKLVGEYNQMLIKLEDSANLLAQNERESAWREMAKQVAHEIKNPLTPMKLNLQYLQHLIKNNSDDFKEKFENASNGIIEQIDSLANIANEFSNFAKFPKTNLQLINLAEIINISVSTFQNQKNVLIINDLKSSQIFVMGDKDQALRVFNNILKNAVQAVDDISEPKIEIGMIESDITIIISIKDNGTGINPELQKKLFTPNFTTKNTGSGLGLAMVKNIMQGFNGKIWFESEINQGTCFYLEFLKKL
jgi:nitrogen fixation/metabolism regulation signal transduction histidine kinase